VGVDVFFVISGYLITALIHRDHVTGRWSLRGFYERRIRRILPALYVVVFSTLALGAIILVPTDLALLGSSVVATTTFVANVYFWALGDRYLLDGTEFMPLLHTWSLAIEEQFYLVFPAFAALVLRFLPGRFRTILAATAALSFALSTYLTFAHPRAAYYASPGRAWELLLGAALSGGAAPANVSSRTRTTLQVAGVAMVVWAAAAYDKQTPFPGVAALVPCIGTLILLAWSHQDSPINRALSHPVLVWCGLISYPLYLWHWPLLVLAKRSLLRELGPFETTAVYAVAAGLAALTWHFVEKPFRDRTRGVPTAQVLTFAVAAGSVALATGLVLRGSGGLLASPPPDVARILDAAKDYAPAVSACHNWNRRSQEKLPACTLGDTSRPEFESALWGDSQAGSLAQAVDSVGKSAGIKVLQLTADNCPPLLQTQVISSRELTDCESRNDIALELIDARHISHVLMVGQWFQYTSGDEWDIALRPARAGRAHESAPQVFAEALVETVHRLRDAGIEVTLVGPVPYVGWNVPAVLATRLWRHWPQPTGPTRAEVLNSQRDVFALLSSLEHEGVAVLYPHESLCPSTCMIELNGVVLYSDQEHLTTRGAELLRPALTAAMSNTANTPRGTIHAPALGRSQE